MMTPANFVKQVIHTTKQLALLHGFKNLEIEDISKELDCHISRIYDYFDTKSELFKLMLMDELKQINDKIALELIHITDLVIWQDSFQKKRVIYFKQSVPIQMIQQGQLDDILEDIVQEIISYDEYVMQQILQNKLKELTS